MNKKIWTILAIVGVVFAAVITVLLLKIKEQDDNLRIIQEAAEFEKQQLQDEYEQLAIQFDGYSNMELENDSLSALLSVEQQRVRDLLEELRITKATDAKRINELKKELATVREIMKSYVAQIDSLDRQNKILTAENIQVRQQYNQVSQKAQDLEQERAQLTEVVSRAAMLEVSDFTCTGMTHRGSSRKHLKNMDKIEFKFSVMKNVTAKPGYKTLYLQIIQPNGEVLTKSPDNTFQYENKQIPYSIEHEFEFQGEQYDDALYWEIEEVLEPGAYNADFFIDGNLCGSFPFTLFK